MQALLTVFSILIKKKDVITQKTSSVAEPQTEPVQWETRVTAPSGALYHWLPWTELRSGSTQAASHV